MFNNVWCTFLAIQLKFCFLMLSCRDKERTKVSACLIGGCQTTISEANNKISFSFVAQFSISSHWTLAAHIKWPQMEAIQHDWANRIIVHEKRFRADYPLLEIIRKHLTWLKWKWTNHYWNQIPFKCLLRIGLINLVEHLTPLFIQLWASMF